jgi:hypothetical protein
MAQYNYIDARGTERGPCDEQLLKELVSHGTIKPGTLLKTDTGDMVVAGQIPDLFSDTQAHTKIPATVIIAIVLIVAIILAFVPIIPCKPCNTTGKGYMGNCPNCNGIGLRTVWSSVN